MSNNPLSSFNLEPLTAPITKLIETLGSGIGAAYEPTHIRRKAKAEANAAIIKAKADIEIRDLEHRAKRRLEALELRRQRNIESIATIAAKQLPSEISQEKVNEDWSALFINFAQDVSDNEMQVIWARLLAGEVAKPGSFSPRTLQLVRLLLQSDAALFQKFTGFLWRVAGDLVHIHYVATDKILEANGLPYDTLLHLDSIGLILMSPDVSLTLTNDNVQAIYFENTYFLKSEKLAGRKIPVRVLTDIGKELAPLCEAGPNRSYHDSIVGVWRHWDALIESTQ